MSNLYKCSHLYHILLCLCNIFIGLDLYAINRFHTCLYRSHSAVIKRFHKKVILLIFLCILTSVHCYIHWTIMILILHMVWHLTVLFSSYVLATSGSHLTIERASLKDNINWPKNISPITYTLIKAVTWQSQFSVLMT